MKAVARLCAVGLSVALAACHSIGPDYSLPKEAAINRADLQDDLAGQDSNVVSAPVPQDWWRLYNDPRLDELVRRAMSSNTNLRVAGGQPEPRAVPGRRGQRGWRVYHQRER
jgi:outer membrane protein TolC